MLKRFMGILLAFIMVIGVFPVSVMAEGEWIFPETSTAVANQVLTVKFGETVVATGNIVDGKVEVTVPYISDEAVRDLQADGRGRKRGMLALHISDGYDDEKITHYMGGFGAQIDDYINWNTYAAEYDDFDEFLLDWYWEIDQLGQESVIKYEFARDTNGEMTRYLDAGESYSERLYIQYFDSVNKEAVAYEHVDVTIHMENIHPEGATQMPGSQVKLNGYSLDSKEIGYDIGFNVNTGELILEMSEEQLWEKEETADYMGNIYTVFEFTAPSENITKYIMAVGNTAIAELNDVGAEDFETDYDPENKPKVTDTLGYFEDGEFYQVFGGEKKTKVCFAWYDGTNISYQYFNIVSVMPPMEEEGGNNQGGNGIPDWLKTWDGYYVNPEQVSLNIPESLRKAVSLGFSDGTAIVTFDVDKLSEEDWIAAYEEVGSGVTQIAARINVVPPVEGIDEAYGENGNGAEPIEQFISNSEQNNHWGYDENQLTGGFTELAQIYKEEGKITIIPTARRSEHYFKVAWYDVDGEDREGNSIPPTYQIMPYYAEIKGNIKSYTFDDVLDYVPDGRITFDSKVNEIAKLSASYDSAAGKIVYKYNHTGDVNKDTPAAIWGNLFTEEEDNNGYYHLFTEIKAPEGYKLKGEPDDAILREFRTIAGENGKIRGHSATWSLEWEIIDQDQISESKPEFVTEWITIDFDPGINFMDVLWDPVTDETRLSYYTQDEEATTKQALIDGSLTMEFGNGLFHTGFDTGKKFNADIVPNAMISIGVPKDDNTYVAFKVNESGGGRQVYYDPGLQQNQDVMIRGGEFYRIDDWMFRCINIAQFRRQNVNGIDVWFTGNAGGEQVLIIDWYTSTEEGAEPAKREYLYVRTDDYINEVTTDSVTEISREVEAPTPIGPDWKLTTNHYPQSGRDDAYYFELEAENAPEGEKVIYIPYSYLDEDLTYEKAVSMKLQPKLHHYDDGYNQIELLKGWLTPYGMKFVVTSFSPFVIAYDIAEDSEVEYNVEIDELTDVPEELGVLYDSVEAMEEALEEELFGKGGIDKDKATIEFMEIELMIKDPQGNWIEVNPDDFPVNGVEVYIPYPQGIDKGEYDFTVAHLISYGTEIGKVEILEPDETEQGLRVKVYSLSPFAVAYQKSTTKPLPNPEPEKESVTIVVDVTKKDEDEENPSTGAPVFG